MFLRHSDPQDGKRIYAACADNSVHEWNLDTQQTRQVAAVSCPCRCAYLLVCRLCVPASVSCFHIVCGVCVRVCVCVLSVHVPWLLFSVPVVCVCVFLRSCAFGVLASPVYRLHVW